MQTYFTAIYYMSQYAKSLNLHFHDVIGDKNSFVASQGREMTHGVVDRHTGGEGDTFVNLLLRVLVHKSSLSANCKILLGMRKFFSSWITFSHLQPSSFSLRDRESPTKQLFQDTFYMSTSIHADGITYFARPLLSASIDNVILVYSTKNAMQREANNQANLLADHGVSLLAQVNNLHSRLAVCQHGLQSLCDESFRINVSLEWTKSDLAGKVEKTKYEKYSFRFNWQWRNNGIAVYFSTSYNFLSCKDRSPHLQSPINTESHIDS